MSAIVTGDRYLEFLVKFVDRNAGPLLDGTLTLKLNPVGLHYVQSRLEALQELDGLLAGAPVDYLRAYVSDLGDHRALEQLRRILGLLTSLKVISVLPPPTRDPTPLSLLPFGRLKVLELRGCDLSTSAARGLLELRHSLEKLICHNSTDALRHVFASRIVDIKDSPSWKRLSFVSCAFNSLVLMDESLQLLPAVETLDLSRNQFAKVANLRKCTKLQHLDLGFNHLRSITSLSEVSCRIVKLVLKNNALTTLRGIENLTSLEGLDLSYNIVSNFSELETLASLPLLQNLWLEGNPLCCARWYRAHVFSFFAYPQKLILDDNGMSTKEYWERHIILASSQKLPSGYGFYFPAKEEGEDEGNLSRKRKKYYRLASIADEDQWTCFCSEAMEQESVSGGSDIQTREEGAISEGESEIVCLMNKVEHMKEQSVLWLREFKEWLDQTPDYTVKRGQCTRCILEPESGKCVKQNKCDRLPGESSKHFQVRLQGSKDGGGLNILKSDMCSADTCTSVCGNGYLHSIGDVNTENSKVNGIDVAKSTSGAEGVGLEQDLVKSFSRKPGSLRHLEVRVSPPSSYLTEERGNQVGKISPVPATAFDEIMGSWPDPRSPPYYQEDILQRRLYLEEEFLQLSADSRSLASSESDTSSSDDDTCTSSVSIADDHLHIQTCMEEHIPGKSTVLSQKNNIDKEGHDGKWSRDNKIFSPDHHDSPGPGCINSDNTNCCIVDDNMSQYGSGTLQIKDKQKHSRRIISISGNSMHCHTKSQFQKANRTLGVGEEDNKGTGLPSCSQNFTGKSSEGTREIHVNSNEEYFTSSKTICPIPGQDQFVKEFFHMRLADSRASETCQQLVCCGCIYELDSVFHEGKVALLRSCLNKFYILLIDAIADEQETNSKLLGCYGLEELREIVVGLGLQALRVHLDGGATYLFLPRTCKKSKDVLYLLGVDASMASTGCSLRSWEQVQVNLLEKYISSCMKMGILLYSMVLFWHDYLEGEHWVARSLCMVNGCLVVCIEDLVHFGYLTENSDHPYYILDLCCAIKDIVEMVIELKHDRCLTLILKNVSSSSSCCMDMIDARIRPKTPNAQVSMWKLKWFSEDTAMKFISVLRAVHLGLTASALPVKCIS